jgi:hypothetical protein
MERKIDIRMLGSVQREWVHYDNMCKASCGLDSRVGDGDDDE